jgi:hypothetical protein
MLIRNDIIKIWIGPGILAEAMDIATIRNDKPPDSDRKFTDDYEGIRVHYWAAICELTWEAMTGWEMDRRRRASDAGVDFEHGGQTYQLKTRNVARFQDPDLLCELDRATADRYVLSEIDADNLNYVQFVGWCTKEELVENVEEIGGNPRYIRKRADLRPIPKGIIK